MEPPSALDTAPTVTVQGGPDHTYEFRVRPVYKKQVDSEELLGPWRNATTRSIKRPAPSNLVVTGANHLAHLRVSWRSPRFFFDPDRNTFNVDFRPVPAEENAESPGPWSPVRDSMIVESSSKCEDLNWLLLEVNPGVYEFRVAADYGDGLSDYIYAIGQTSTFPPAENLQLSPTAKRGELRVEWEAPAAFDSARDVFRLQFRPAPGIGMRPTPWELANYAYRLGDSFLIKDMESTSYEVRLSVLYGFHASRGQARSSDYIYATGTPLEYANPTGFEAQPAAAEVVRLGWLHPDGFNAAIDYYEVMYREVDVNPATDEIEGHGPWQPASPLIVSGANQEVTITRLEAVLHEFVVRAVYVDSLGRPQGWSGYESVQATPHSAFLAPTEFAVQSTDDSGELMARWVRTPLFKPSSDRYEMDYRTRTTSAAPWSDWQPTPPTALSSVGRIETHTLTGVSIAQHEVRLRAKYVGFDGTVTYSGYVTAIATPCEAPAAAGPTFTAGPTDNAGELLASWPAAAGFDSSKDYYRIGHIEMVQPETQNRLRVQDSGGYIYNNTSDTSLVLTGLTGELYWVAGYWIEVDLADSDNNVYHALPLVSNNWGGDTIEVSPKPLYPSPANLEMKHNGSQLVGTWDEPDGFGSNDVYETQYRDITRDEDAAWSTWTEQTGTTWSLIASAAAGHYDFRVRAKYKDSSGSVLGYSSWLHSWFHSWRQMAEVPSSQGKPSNIQITPTPSNGGDMWTWDEPAGFDPATDKYQFSWRRLNPLQGTYLEWATNQEFTLPRYAINSPIDHNSWQMRIRAKYVDAQGNDTYSDWVLVDQPLYGEEDNAAYSSPMNLSAEFVAGSDGNYLIGWQPPDGFNALTDSYELEHWDTGSDRGWSSPVEISGLSNSYTLGPADFQESWLVRVRAEFVDEGAVNYSRFQGVGFSRPAAEESPTSLVVTEHDEGYRLDLSWTNHADFDASRDKYEIEYQDTAWQSEGTNRYEDLAVISDTSYIVRNLEWDAVYNFRVRAAHYDVNGNFEAYSDWIYGSGSPLQGDGPLLSDLGALTGTVEISGAWIADYASVSRADRYARFYSFTLGDENQVQIELTSTDEDTYLYLLSGAGYRDPETDELLFGPWFPTPPHTTSANVHLLGSLSKIPYRVRVRAAYYDSSGSLEGHSPYIYGQGTPLASAVIDLGTLTEAHSVSGEWDASLKSVNRVGNYNAKFYSFSLAQADRVQIDLSSSEDAYLFLLSGTGTDGRIIMVNDDGDSGTDSRIIHSLDVGDCTIEATTLLQSKIGAFNLSVSFPVNAVTPTTGLITPVLDAQGDWTGDFNVPINRPAGFDPNTDSYEYQHDDGSGWQPAAPTAIAGDATSHTVGTIPSGETWDVRFRAKYVAQNGTVTYSDYTRRTISMPAEVTHPAPLNFGVAATDTPQELHTTWDHPGEFNSATDEYEIERRTEFFDPETGNPYWSAWTSPSPSTTRSNGYTLSNMGTDRVEVRVRTAYYGAGNVLEGRSDYVSGIATPAAAPPSYDPASGLSLLATTNGLSLSWTAPGEFDSATDAFQVQYRVEVIDPDTESFEWSAWTPVAWYETTNDFYYITGLSVEPHEARVRVAYRDADNTLLAYSDSVSVFGSPTGQQGSDDPEE